MAAKKRSPKGTTKGRKRRPSNARPRKVKHGSAEGGTPSATERKRVIREAAELSGTKRQPSWGQMRWLVALMAEHAGVATPTTYAEANVQIRTMAGTRANASKAAADKAAAKALTPSGTVRPPVTEPDTLAYLGAVRAVEDAS